MIRKMSAAVLSALLFAQPVVAHAAAAEDDRPWARGVTDANQKAALELFRQANSVLKESGNFSLAAAKYREALKLWDHPAIHYNLALALNSLEQPLEARDHFEQAMRFGPKPLDLDKFEQANREKNALEKKLASVEVKCDEEGAKVTLDGRDLFVGPGKWAGFVVAGPHSIVASKPGMLTNEASRKLPPGEVSTFDLKLFSADEMTEYRRKWPTWMPWTVLGAGAAVALAGGGMHYTAAQDFKSFDQSINECGGCIPAAAVAAQRSQADTLQSVAIGSYAVGGAAIAAGATLVYLNRLQPYRRGHSAEVQTEMSVVPVVGGGTNGLLASFRF